MAEISFYHLTRQTLEQSLPELLAKVVGQGLRTLVKLNDTATMEMLDKALWTYDPESFLPHDKDGCAQPHMQQIFLTLGDDNANSATILTLINNAVCPDMVAYDRVLYMFDGRDDAIVSRAREHWKTFSDQNFTMSYWQQKETGGWEKKA